MSAAAQVTVGAPVPPKGILFIASSVSLNNFHNVLRNRLVNTGYTVIVKGDNYVTLADASGKDLIVISDTVTASLIGTMFTFSTVPIFNFESNLYHALGMTGPIAGTDCGANGGALNLNITAPGNPIAAGLIRHDCLDDDDGLHPNLG